MFWFFFFFFFFFKQKTAYEMRISDWSSDVCSSDLDTLLRMIRSAPVPDFAAPTIVGIDDWAWRRGQRYGTIICDLERNRVLDLLPDRNADSVANWLKRYPGIKVVARDRADLYADGARRGAPGAMQVADRWHQIGSAHV